MDGSVGLPRLDADFTHPLNNSMQPDPDSSDSSASSASAQRIVLGFEHTYADQLEGLYAPWQPAGFPAPELLYFNHELSEEFQLPSLSQEQLARLFSGSELARDARPLAQAYAGHQFGSFVPRLGDGRALLLGELVSPAGRRIDVQLKGSGRTPFSRGGDGKAALGPILRETLVAEAMHHLGIPTTRVLAAVATGQTVQRDRPLPGAVLARTAASHLRVGTLEFCAASGDRDKLERLVSYALMRHYPERSESDNHAAELLLAVAQAQGNLIAQWMLVGFIHGVMNTDNMTLSGETIDYGPCAFLEQYDPETVYSSIDHYGRYAYGNQAAIGGWNLARMAQALLPLLAPDRSGAIGVVRTALGVFQSSFDERMLSGMRDKLGLAGEAPGDEALIAELLGWMRDTQQDYTSTFRRLASSLVEGCAPFDDEEFQRWYRRYRSRHQDEAPHAISERMNRVNPWVIPRNHLVEEALDAAIAGDLGPFSEMMEVLADPCEPAPGRERFAEPAPADFGPYRTFCGT